MSAPYWRTHPITCRCLRKRRLAALLDSGSIRHFSIPCSFAADDTANHVQEPEASRRRFIFGTQGGIQPGQYAVLAGGLSSDRDIIGDGSPTRLS